MKNCCEASGFNCNQGRLCTARQDIPPYTPETVMSWPELGMTLLVGVVTGAMLVWFLADNWPRLVSFMGSLW